MAREKKKQSFSLYKLGIYMLIAAGLFLIGRQEYRIRQLEKERAQVQARIDVLKAKEKALEAERQRLHDPRYVEKLAREEYNMVGKNEVPLFVVEDEQKQASFKEKEAGKEIKKQ